MATYCIGDIHGCFVEFLQLLEKMQFNPDKDKLLLTGDLIGRGPYPLETMNYIMHLNLCEKCLHAVLGNHDLNFIAVYYGLGKLRPNYNLDRLLAAPNVDKIIKFLCSLPLLYINKEQKAAICHAGIYPSWGLHEASLRSQEISEVLNNPVKRQILLRNMYANTPKRYDPKDSDLLRWRFIINAFTRMRLCDKNLNLDYNHRSLSPQEALNLAIFPWFNYGHPSRFDGEQYELIFGHWSALQGKCYRPHIIALDTGCVWGKSLSGYCLETGEHFQVESKQKSTDKKKNTKN